MPLIIGLILIIITIAVIVAKSQNVPKENNEYLGKSIKDITNEFGIPNKEYKIGKYKILEYVSEHGSFWTRGAFSNTKDISKFYFDQDKVIKHEQFSEK